MITIFILRMIEGETHVHCEDNCSVCYQKFDKIIYRPEVDRPSLTFQVRRIETLLSKEGLLRYIYLIPLVTVLNKLPEELILKLDELNNLHWENHRNEEVEIPKGLYQYPA